MRSITSHFNYRDRQKSEGQRGFLFCYFFLGPTKKKVAAFFFPSVFFDGIKTKKKEPPDFSHIKKGKHLIAFMMWEKSTRIPSVFSMYMPPRPMATFPIERRKISWNMSPDPLVGRLLAGNQSLSASESLLRTSLLINTLKEMATRRPRSGDRRPTDEQEWK